MIAMTEEAIVDYVIQAYQKDLKSLTLSGVLIVFAKELELLDKGLELLDEGPTKKEYTERLTDMFISACNAYRFSITTGLALVTVVKCCCINCAIEYNDVLKFAVEKVMKDDAE